MREKRSNLITYKKFWYAIDKDSSDAYLYVNKPYRSKSSFGKLESYWHSTAEYYHIDTFGLTIDDLPKMTWADEPICITLNIDVQL